MKSSSVTEKALAAALRVSAALFGMSPRRDDSDDDDDDDLPRPNATVSWRSGLVRTAALAI